MDDRISENCVANLTEQIDYITPPSVVVFHNQETVSINEFGEDRISRFSSVHTIQFDPKQPSWIPIDVSRNLLSDETTYLQYGQAQNEVEYNTIVWSEPLPSGWMIYPDPVENPEGLAVAYATCNITFQIFLRRFNWKPNTWPVKQRNFI